ncbi:hypothetical protein [Fulvivirga ligni]|uniref:hypothetical protein n=1 Tax=Fulvivirga ligni TaxID=2904246 RepID=UPI001F37B047|nr:hypothetical protein [Fulvivirga ligni]UII21580.1 hypothetical protein LVD16_27510 [Fulvivirga ligni]UII21634.1 hypothetical protein LVD16_00075 [Fulvivirga ligni]
MCAGDGTNSLNYAGIANYLSKNTGEKGEQSRQICAALKAGRQSTINSVIGAINKNLSFFEGFLGPNTTLIPIPRSTPLLNGGIWPAKIIADELVKNNLANTSIEIIQRTKRISASSSRSSAKDRSEVHEHRASLQISPEIIHTNNIILVDDVVTLGRTSYACFLDLQKYYSGQNIMLFSVFVTKGLEEHKTLDIITQPQSGIITFNSTTGKTTRQDINSL